MRNIATSSTAGTSAAATENQIPSSPHSSGKISTVATWNTIVRKNEISAEVSPSLSAVKNAEPSTAVPESRKEIE